MEDSTNTNETNSKTELQNDEQQQKAVPVNKQIPARAYLDSTVNPVLLMGLAELSRIRPEDPVEWLGNYLLQNNPMKNKESQQNDS